MNTKMNLCAAIAFAGTALGASTNAHAGCLSYGAKSVSDVEENVSGLLRTNGEGFVSIIGMWHVQFISEGNQDSLGIPDGTPLDDALATWHADGTEIMNSSRAPVTQSFCTGVWKQIGRSTYRLRHIALSWKDAENAEGPAEIHETVALDRTGTHFTGHFAIDQYETGKPGTEESGTPVHIVGRLVGDRVTVN